jgi:hypothetical protein
MSGVTSQKITPDIANWWLDYYDCGGYGPGDFVQSLMQAIVRADAEHLQALWGPFPGLVDAFQIGQRLGGIEELSALAEP